MGLGWRPALLALLLGLGGGPRAQEQLPQESHNLNWLKVSLVEPSPGARAGVGEGSRQRAPEARDGLVGGLGTGLLVLRTSSGDRLRLQNSTADRGPQAQSSEMGTAKSPAGARGWRGGGVSRRALE